MVKCSEGVCGCVRACVRACVCACVCACPVYGMHAHVGIFVIMHS